MLHISFTHVNDCTLSTFDPGQALHLREGGQSRIDQLHELGLPAKAPGLVKQTPADDRGMIEIARDRSPHYVFVTPPALRRIAAFPEVREVREQKNTERIRVIKQERIIDLDMDSQKIEPGNVSRRRCRLSAAARLPAV